MSKVQISSRRRWMAIAAHAVAVGVPALSLGGVTFSSGSATWSCRADDTNPSSSLRTTFTLSPPSSGSLPSAPTYQLNRTGTVGSGSGVGKGSIGYVTNSTTASFTFAGGSGAAQADANNDLPGNTISKVQFSGLFDPTSPSFGPTATGYFSLTVAGTAGIGGSAQVVGDLSFKLNNSAGANLRSPISFGDTFNGGGSPTPFSKTYTYCSALSPSSLSPGQKIFVSGTLTFIASNFGSPSDVVPIQFEAGGAPPTSTFFVAGGSAGDWTNPATWTPPSDPGNNVFQFTEPGALVPVVPNGIGDRARFVNVGAEPRSVTLDSPITLGAIHIDDDGTVGFQNSAALTGSLEMNVQAGEASIYSGNSFGTTSHPVTVPVNLHDNLDVRVEGDVPFSGGRGSMEFGSPINPVGGNKDVSIRGTGAVAYNSANNYGGTTLITDKGTLKANADGCLSTGPVIVDGGQLVINTPNPFGPGGGNINVSNGGIVLLGVPNIQNTTMTFADDGSGFIGSPAELGLITVNSGSVNIVGGVFVGHTDFVSGPAGNPQFPVPGPKHVFGIATSFMDPGTPGITVGGDSPGPWVGFGSDYGVRTYGDSPFNPGGPVLGIAGNATISSLGGALVLNARLDGALLSEVQVKGAGIVSVDSMFNTYAGQMTVTDGATLRVNGVLPAVQNVTVQSGGTVGGDGTIGGNVVVQDGGVLDPGIGFYNNVTGDLNVGPLSLSANSILDFEFGASAIASDIVHVTGDLNLDGQLIINQLQFFDTQDMYTLFTYTGGLEDGGLLISPLSQEIFGVPAPLAASILIIPNPTGLGGSVVLAIPEPGVFGAVSLLTTAMLRRRRR